MTDNAPITSPNAPTSNSYFSDTERRARLKLIRTENVGPITFFRLLERFRTAEQALEALPTLAKRGGRRTPVTIYPDEKIEDELMRLHKAGGGMVHVGEPDYPPLLAQIEDAPPILFILGNHRLLRKRALGIIGARNGSLNGQRFARTLAAELGSAGFLITSGMARGIDAAAHAGALDSGTVAVLGGGVDVVYPKENLKLYEGLLERGAVVSEVPIGTSPQARHFPRRNRIISGMARGIVVIEAGAKSGSLITARLALDQGREVFAVPGAPHDPRVKGTNTLIRDGAHLTESSDDVLSGLNTLNFRSDRTAETALNDQPMRPIDQGDVRSAHECLTTLLDHAATGIDDLVRESGLDPAALSVAILELELAGRVTRLPGNQITRIF